MAENVSLAHREQRALSTHKKFEIELLLIFSPLIYHRPNSILSNRIEEKNVEEVLLNPVTEIDKRIE